MINERHEESKFLVNEHVDKQTKAILKLDMKR